jgi:hypothetical protein
MHDASSQLRVGPLLDRTDDREKDARMKLLDRRISVAPMMDWSDKGDRAVETRTYFRRMVLVAYMSPLPETLSR